MWWWGERIAAKMKESSGGDGDLARAAVMAVMTMKMMKRLDMSSLIAHSFA